MLDDTRNTVIKKIPEDYELKKLELQFYIAYQSIIYDYLIEEVIPSSNKEIIKSLTLGIREIKDKLDKKTPNGCIYLREILITIKFSLVESIYVRQSLYIRYLLKNVFNIEYNCADRDIVELIIPNKENPLLFASENYYDKVKKLEIDEILIIPLKLKPPGKIFENYTTSYPFDKSTAWKELIELSYSYGRILIYENFFFWYSGIIPKYVNSLYVIMEEEGNIPVTWRYYIAMMAVSTINCYYLFKHLQNMFLLKGGDDEWIILGLQAVPKKLQILSKVNNILAHQPWKLTVRDINELITMKNGWNRDEFVHAALIMINFHRLAAIVESMKITLLDETTINERVGEKYSLARNEENSCENNSTFVKENPNNNKNDNMQREGKIKLYNNLIEMNEKHEEADLKNERKYSLEDMKFVNDGREMNNILRNFISNYCTLYMDFDVYSDNHLSNMNFSWDNEGCYILENIYDKGVEALNTEIKHFIELTSNTIGGDTKKLDTFHFRNSIRCYLEKIFGIVNEDYDYSKTNKLLQISTKTFIKNIACLPQRIAKNDIPILGFTFSYEEIIHLICVVSIHKARVELTFLSYVIYDIIKSIE